MRQLLIIEAIDKGRYFANGSNIYIYSYINLLAFKLRLLGIIIILLDIEGILTNKCCFILVVVIIIKIFKAIIIIMEVGGTLFICSKVFRLYSLYT